MLASPTLLGPMGEILVSYLERKEAEVGKQYIHILFLGTPTSSPISHFFPHLFPCSKSHFSFSSSLADYKMKFAKS